MLGRRSGQKPSCAAFRFCAAGKTSTLEPASPTAAHTSTSPLQQLRNQTSSVLIGIVIRGVTWPPRDAQIGLVEQLGPMQQGYLSHTLALRRSLLPINTCHFSDSAAAAACNTGFSINTVIETSSVHVGLSFPLSRFPLLRGPLNFVLILTMVFQEINHKIYEECTAHLAPQRQRFFVLVDWASALFLFRW